MKLSSDQVQSPPGAREIPEIITRILSARGMASAQMSGFLYPNYEQDLGDPMLMTDMDLAVARIILAIEREERVVVYGDYDIDGITASAVLIEALREQGLEVSSYIPDRFEEGYGINQAALERLQQEGAQLVISVDCGITSVSEAGWARAHGLSLIITDHHAVGSEIPDAEAVINPKRPGDQYPFKDLAGVGVAFKLVQALAAATGRPAAGQEKWLLDLVAMGTICDVVPLVGENRALASYGLRVLRQTRRIGLRALAQVGGVSISGILAHQVGFILGPRMNAAGRLEHAARSLELVQTDSDDRAKDIADELEQLNLERRADQARIFAAADALAEQYRDDAVLVLAHADWSHGVVGIVASKLAEKWQRPVLLAQVLDDRIKGSARSVVGFNMVEALRSQTPILEKFGGHFFAAGYSLPTAQWGALRAGLNAYFASVMTESEPNEDKAVPELAWDDLALVDTGLLETLELLEPYGNANPQPLVGIRGLSVERVRPVGADAKHLSMRLRDEAGRMLGVIGFGLAERYQDVTPGRMVSVRGHLNTNEYQGRISIQMILSELSYE
jgi:single-stranded-DNA-specific exonuclease